MRARVDADGAIHSDASHELAKDITRFLITLVRNWKTRQPHNAKIFTEAEALMSILKTIALERARDVFNEQARQDFARHLDHEILIRFLPHRL